VQNRLFQVRLRLRTILLVHVIAFDLPEIKSLKPGGSKYNSMVIKIVPDNKPDNTRIPDRRENKTNTRQLYQSNRAMRSPYTVIDETFQSLRQKEPEIYRQFHENRQE